MKYFFLMMVTLLFQSQSKAQQLPQLIEYHNNTYQLCQDFTLRYGLVIKIADIGWYAPACENNSLTEQTDKIIRFHYHKNVSADFFKKSAEEYFLLNLNNQAEQSKLATTLKQFNQAYTNIKSGEYFDLVHWNDQQLSLWKNKQLLTETDDPVFAKKYFNIWFGKNPVIKKLKTAFIES